MATVEANFDGLIGPTHNYSGLSYGNVASLSNKKDVARPREAALQGLMKMKALADRGYLQGILPPMERPNVALLRKWGFAGKTDAEVVARAWESPIWLAMASSAASMWTANAATVSPSADTADGKVHFTPANLSSNAHRAQEPETTQRSLRAVFPDESVFRVHDPVVGGDCFGDEGAANHTRLCTDYGSTGVEIFTYGRVAFDNSAPKPKLYPARQTLESCQVMARTHGLDPARTFYVQQHPDTIDQGVFHNDVISVGNREVFFCHEEAFVNDGDFWKRLQDAFPALKRVVVKTADVPVKEAVKTYLFNTQLLALPGGGMLLVAPTECRESTIVKPYIDRLIADKACPINEVLYFDLRQSMKNGGGPACLRLRVVLTDKERAAVNQACLVSDANYGTLVKWVEKHYREELSPEDLRDPKLLDECRRALDELTGILKLGSLYPFQR